MKNSTKVLLGYIGIIVLILIVIVIITGL